MIIHHAHAVIILAWIWVFVFCLGATRMLYLAHRKRRTAATVTKGPDLAALFDVAQAERELKRPLADIIAEAERKAIAIHSPLGDLPETAGVVQPSVYHPTDPCYLPNCPEARSLHEHVEMIGAGQYIIPLQPKANLGRRGGRTIDNIASDPFMPSGTLSGAGAIEVTALGDRERTFLDPEPHLISTLEAKGELLRAQLENLARRPTPNTPAEEELWDVLSSQYLFNERKLESWRRACRRNTTSGPARRSKR